MSATASLFESSLGSQLPLRGAIAFGDVLEDAGRRILLSAVIPDLVSSEKEQEWAGIRVLEPAVDPIIDGLYGTSDSEIPRSGTGHVVHYDVPTKTGIQHSLVLNWVYLCNQRDLDTGLSFLTGRKRDETSRFVDAIKNRLPPDLRLPEKLGSVVSCRVRVYRGGFNIKFSDADGNGADLPEGTTMHFSIFGPVEEPSMEATDGTG